MASLVCYGLTLLLFHHAYSIAAKAYNDLCSSQGITFWEGYSVNYLGITLIVVATPLFLARSQALIAVNLLLGLITILIATSLLVSAEKTPYECYTTMGIYEDRTSGLSDVDDWFTLATFLSYLLLLVDLAIWGARKLIGWVRMRQGSDAI
ncbi:MAG: hypothetical protein KGK01_01740 [Bradyrhizobium sp.]|uniref:hypothetical protein n=1 Tax=Bradyrhizobium sp. TaxID=376 RepID=UPI001C29B959|nr:hypothetical protein [Bradyrhizobium sp.]MBU6463181.1 hypothetical protein [Pseudomonadota bacterium]MDE2066987.1 hypothetical protein [Bradyrhizobium sp.]MDE2241188.1 hypothetical protein [Bradyrhizobium sp.]MDE2473088.1 hypothetical protein [Bradyrhizobium sp.]